MNKSTSPDNTSPRILKELGRQVIFPITKIFNTLLLGGKVPNFWKLANVSPISKIKKDIENALQTTVLFVLLRY